MLKNFYVYYYRNKFRFSAAFRYAFGKSHWKMLADILYAMVIIMILAACIWYTLNAFIEEAENKAGVQHSYQRNLEKVVTTCFTGGGLKVGDEWFMVDKPISIGVYK